MGVQGCSGITPRQLDLEGARGLGVSDIFVGGLTWSCNCRREREHVTHSCPAAEDLELSRRNLILEGDFRALQAILLGFSALVAGLTGEMASLVDFGQSALNREGA